MNTENIIMLIIPFVLIGVWLLVMSNAESEARRKLGEEVVEIVLYRRWMLVLQRIVLVVAVVLPIVVAAVGVLTKTDGTEVLFETMRSLWMGGVFLGVRKVSHLLIGTHGFVYGAQEMVPWRNVESIVWDRDIGQRQWGMTLKVRTGRSGRFVRSMRLYVRRELREEAGLQLERFREAATGPAAILMDALPKKELSAV